VPRVLETSRDPELTQAFAVARTVFRREAGELFFPTMLLPRNKRDAVHAVAAMCVMIREALAEADLPPAVSGGCCGGSFDSAVARIRERIEQVYGRRLALAAAESRPVIQHILLAAAKSVRRHEIPRQLFIDFVEACRTDRTTSRYATWTALTRYLDRRGGAVAAMIGCIVGVTHSDAGDAIAKLAQATQLTQLLRTIPADHARGRIYLPLADLARSGYSERELARGVVNEHLRALLRCEVERARRLLREGADAIPWLAGDAAKMAAAVHVVQTLEMLRMIERGGGDVLNRPPTLSAAHKLRRLPDAWRLARRGSAQPLPRIFSVRQTA